MTSPDIMNPPEPDIDMLALLRTCVCSLVRDFAASAESTLDEQLALQASLFRLLGAECEEKAADTASLAERLRA